MRKKVVRDIQKKSPVLLSLASENIGLPFSPGAASAKAASAQKKRLIDCSGMGEKKSVITGTKASFMQDVGSSKLEKRKKDRVLYFQISADEPFKPDRIGDTMRVFAAGLVVLFVINIINVYHRGIDLKNAVVASATVGYEELLSAGSSAADANFVDAENAFVQAKEKFRETQESIAFLSANNESRFGSEKTVDSANALLNAAQQIAISGEYFARGVENLQHVPTLFVQANLSGGQNSAAATENNGGGATQKSLTEKLKEDLENVQKAGAGLRTAQQELDKVDPSILPRELREKFAGAREQLTNINTILATTEQKIPALLDLLGDRHPHRYLVLLQNDTESRPTGGFIGSYLIVDINDGYITKMDFHDIYELDGQLHEYIQPPEDIATVSDTWRMRDSNYSPDFTISAEKAAWFLQKQNGPSVDSVIAINQSFVKELLKISGPVQLGSLDAPINENNYQTVISYLVETKESGVTAPKKILQELVPAFQRQLFASKSFSELLPVFMQGINNKKIFLYSRNEPVQKLFDELKLSGRIFKTIPGEDYFMVTATSIGGNKSDQYIDQNLRHYSIIREDGTIIDEVTITRKHTWTSKDLEAWQNMLAPFGFTSFPPHIIQILGQGTNKSFIKVYVPQGSQLSGTLGIKKEEIMARHDEEIGKDYFMFSMDVQPGREESISISYQLPQKLNFLPADNYRLFTQNQPAARPSYLEKKVFFKPGIESHRQHPSSFALNEKGYLEFGGLFDRDLYLSALVGK